MIFLGYNYFLKEAGVGNILSKIQPYASKALTGAKGLAKQEWRDMGTFGRVLTGVSAASTAAGMMDKTDSQGKGRTERLLGGVGNIAGGLVGGGLGTRAAKMMGNSRMGRVGGFVAQGLGGLAGSYAGEKALSAPFKSRMKPPQQPSYALEQAANPNQNLYPAAQTPIK
jgi:hypothetical protein